MNHSERSTRNPHEHISPLQLSMYADGETPREERAEIEARLSACPACSARLDALRSVSATLAALPRTTPSAGVFDKVLAGARRVDNASSAVSRERLGRARGIGPVRLREVRLPDTDAPASIAPTRRRSHWRAPFTGALPTIAALLLIALTAGLLMRSSLVTTMQPSSATPTPTIPPGDTLNATKSAVGGVASLLRFTPVTPTYLPDGARLHAVTVTPLTQGERLLDVTWIFSAGPLRTLHLREQPASSQASAYTSQATQTQDLAWQVSQSNPWRALEMVEGPGWRGVEQTRGDARLSLDTQPAVGASTADVDTELRLVSLSMDMPYAMPRVAIGSPHTGSLLRSIASVMGTDGQVWNWDVTLSGDTRSRNATVTSPSGGLDVTEITASDGAGVRLDWIHKVYQTLHGPTLYKSTPHGVTEIAYTAETFLGTGQLWYLRTTTITPPGDHSMKVYDLYRVDTALPEHVYADVITGEVVAIFVEANSLTSPGGAGSAQPYISSAVCAPYKVTYTWIIFEPAAQSASRFNTSSPSSGWTKGSVPQPFTCGI